MGIYDRDYYREQGPGFGVKGPRTVVGILVLINVVVYLVDGLFFSKTHELTGLLAATDTTLSRPWMWWQLLTYGFAHDPLSFTHILFNMLQLWFLGRDVEHRYGAKEFLRLYLVMLVLGSLGWCIAHIFDDGQFKLLGASGAVSGIVFLFVLNFPQRTLILFPIPIPIKAWVIGVLLVVGNLWGSLTQIGNVAFGVHLVGLAFAYVYFRFKWNLGTVFSFSWLKGAPRLRVHDPDDQGEEDNLSQEVDRILEKIHRQGEASLTRQERRTLETASRQYQKKRE